MVQIIAEDAAWNRRMEKTDRLKKAWKLSMEHKKCQRMIMMMETLSMLEMEMEMDWIETKILQMMESDDLDDGDVQVGVEDRDGDQVIPQEESLTQMEEECLADMVEEYD